MKTILKVTHFKSVANIRRRLFKPSCDVLVACLFLPCFLGFEACDCVFSLCPLYRPSRPLQSQNAAVASTTIYRYSRNVALHEIEGFLDLVALIGLPGC